MKRKLSLALAVVLAAGSMPMTAMAASFKDINDVPWAASTIMTVADRGLINGYEDNTFRAKNNVTYTETMVMLYNVLSKTNSLQTMDTSSMAGYYQMFSTFKIPTWAQASVLYGLGTNVLFLSDLSKFYDNGVARPASREDVAVFFGRALAEKYDVWNTPTVVYQDQWNISDAAVPYVDLLSRLGIFSGDDQGKFNPKSPITRAEMAVIMNKTYDLLGNNLSNQGEITKIENDEGDFYTISFKMDNGDILKFGAMDDRVGVYNKDGSMEIALSSLSVGDRVSLVYTSSSLQSIYLLEEISSAQSRYDATGYVEKLDSRELWMENENSGETQRYVISSDCVCFLDGKKTTYQALEDFAEENYNKFIHAGLMFSTETVKGDKGNYEKYTVEELYLSVSDTHTTSGEVKSFSDSRVSFRTSGGADKTVYFDKNCEFYIGEEKSSVSKLEDLAESGTTYVKVTTNMDNKATKVIMAEDTFDTNIQQSATTYTVEGISEKQMVVSSSGKKTTYTFGSSNPLDNITFYIWIDGDKDWEKVKFSNAQNYFENKNTTYCRVVLNSGGKISEIYFSDKRSAWSESTDLAERKGTVASLENGVLKFKTTSTQYQMLSKYVPKDESTKDTDNTINITSAVKSSLTVFERMANSPDVTLYAEIKADADNKVQEVTEAYLTYAKGTLVEYETASSDRHISIQTSDGAKLNLNVVGSPKTGSEDYTYEDLATNSYIGSTVELEFNSSGYVSKITVDEDSVNSLIKSVSGMAVAANDGLKFEDSKTVYPWRSDVTIRSKSFDSTALYRLKEMIEDEDVEVYVKAKLAEDDRVDVAEVTVKAAEGTLQEYDDDDHTVRILTDEGHKFTFNVVNRPTSNISGVTIEKLDDVWNGKKISLVFDDSGYVKAFEK